VFRIAVAVLVATLSGCSLQNLATDRLADALAGQGAGFARDDDPQLIRDAAPFSLKLIETVIAERPRHRELLTAAARGFTQYAYAFLQQEADFVEDTDIAAATRLRERARGLYRRARDYGLQGLAPGEAGLAERLRSDPPTALGGFGRGDVPLLYWTAAAWAGWIGQSRDDSSAVADLPVALALLDRALALDEAYDGGALHGLAVTLEASRPGDPAAIAAEARRHFERAVALSGGALASPYVALAESVAIPRQERREFERLLQAALAVDPDRAADRRLENRVMQQRARWLQQHADKFFIE
jgi:predicted anti-sigma-YlaC factor YlaD